jgi:GPI mannosyltransferase 3
MSASHETARVSRLDLRSQVSCALAVIVTIAALLRLWGAYKSSTIHPDEYFQYLEPAWFHLTGTGIETWEWRDGVRSWVLPFYNGAWLALLMRLGVERGASLGWVIKTHWGLLSIALVLLAYRAGCAGTRAALRRDPRQVAQESDGYQGGLLAAAMCAGFPLLVRYANHTLSELPSMLCLVAGLTFAAEVVEAAWGPAARNKAAWAGVLLSAGACLRIVNGPLALVAPAWLLLSRRWRPLQALLAGALVPLLVFGVVDWITWGSFASSYVGYVKFNFVEGKAAIFGIEAPSWYVDTLFERAPLGLPILLGLGLAGVRWSWPYLVTALVAVAYLSTQGHKEERFIVLVWPLLLIAAAITIGIWLARLTPSRSLVTGYEVAAALCLVILIDGSRHLPPFFFEQERLDCQAWIGSRRSVRGLLVDNILLSGGGLWFGSRAPLQNYTSALLDNPLFSHVLTSSGSSVRLESEQRGFKVVHTRGSLIVLRRR